MMLSPQSFLLRGLDIMNKSLTSSDKINNRRFRSHFGISPKVCYCVWMKSLSYHPTGSKDIHLLMALHFLKCYNTESVNASLFQVDEKTYRKWQWIFVRIIAELKIVR